MTRCARHPGEHDPPLARAGVALGAILERTEGVVRQWPVAGVALLALAALLGAAMVGRVQ